MTDATHAQHAHARPQGGDAHARGGDAAAHGHGTHAHDDGHGHGSRASYLAGFLLSVVLTAIPFWLVMTGVLADAQATTIAIVLCAVLQIVVHTVAFLHVNTRSEGGWTLMAYVFTAVLVLIVIAGSLWIMFHLNTNMMPMTGMGDAP